MRHLSNRYVPWVAAGGMIFLILDSEHALTGAREGLELCCRAVIPSLFPFFVLSILLTNCLRGRPLPLFKPFGKLCGIPEGGESLLAIGLLGGYPVGAQCIYNSYHSGHLSKADAKRLLGFCSNAGPSFIFGILSALFSEARSVWILWLIHIISALLVGMLLPGKSSDRFTGKQAESFTVQHALKQSLHTMGYVCGWIILFRVVTVILNRWFLWLLPSSLQVIIIGMLELTNGCLTLNNVTSESTRFIICAALLAFGGACVGMQTASVCGELGTGMYFPGKILQSIFSVSLAIFVHPFLFPEQLPQNHTVSITATVICVILIAITILRFQKKTVAFQQPIMYNEKKVNSR